MIWIRNYNKNNYESLVEVWHRIGLCKTPERDWCHLWDPGAQTALNSQEGSMSYEYQKFSITKYVTVIVKIMLNAYLDDSNTCWRK